MNKIMKNADRLRPADFIDNQGARLLLFGRRREDLGAEVVA